ncbi:peroxisome proliferator-activated receptor gamma coactivator-related protein 1 [Discoglossus pictus]
MAARWGAGEETLTIGGMEFFAADSPFQCHDLDEDEPCPDLSDLSLTSLDAGGILGTFQGYVDHSIISIINAPETQAENKGLFDEENELSLLTALTEILDNADDENLSPFDTIPDSDLLVSPKERENSSLQKFLSLSRTPPDREILSVEDPRRINGGKLDGRTTGQNWELFPENISSTPKRKNRQRSARGCLPRRARTPTQQRSDGEEEEIHSPEKIETGQEFSIDSALEENELEEAAFLKQNTPCIINTENVALNDLVKYMHPYCLPSITVCLDPEDGEIDEEMLSNAVFLEIVSEEGECIKLPMLMETDFSAENSSSLSTMEELVSESSKSDSIDESVGEHCVPVHGINCETLNVQATDNSLESCEQIEQDIKDSLENVEATQMLEPLQQTKLLENELKDVPPLQANSDTKSEMDISVLAPNGNIDDQNLDHMNTKNESVSCAEDTCTEQVVQKENDIGRAKGRKRSKRLAKRNKKLNDGKPQNVVLQKTLQSTAVNQNASTRSNNPSLQESDFLVKQIDQVNRVSQMELRSSKIVRPKGRIRSNLDNSNSVEKKCSDNSKKSEQQQPVEKELPKSDQDNVTVVQDLAQSDINENLCETGEVISEQTKGETVLNYKNVQPNSLCSQESPVALVSGSELKNTGTEADNLMKPGDKEECVAAQLTKEAKPKPLSLSEYRMRMLQRKPNAEERDNASESKWPTIPEPPTELAEIPCLIVPGKDTAPLKPTKTTITKEDKPCPINENEKSLRAEGLLNFGHVQTEMILPPVKFQEALQPTRVDVQCPPVAMEMPPVTMPPPINVPPPFYPPAWPCFPTNPCYPSLPQMPLAPHFPNRIPHDPLHVMPVETPVMNWPVPPYPPMGQVPPPNVGVWSAGVPPPYWPSHPMPQFLPEHVMPLQSSPEKFGMVGPQGTFTAPLNVPPDLTFQQNTYIAPVESQSIPPQSNQIKMFIQKTDHVASVPKETSSIDNLTKEKRSPSKPPPKSLNKSTKLETVNQTELIPPIKAEKTPTKMPPDPKKSVPVPDLKSANQVVFKIMEMLKRMQKQGIQIKPQTSAASTVSTSTAPPASQKAPHSIEPLDSKKGLLTSEDTQVVEQAPAAVLDKPNIAVIHSVDVNVLKPATVDKPSTQSPHIVADAQTCVPQDVEPAQDVSTTEGSIKLPLLEANINKSPVENLAIEKGIEASDLTSLLEEFEKSEAKDDDHQTQSPVLKLAVGNSRTEKPVEKKTLLAPELVNTAGLTPPATPPHQLWKSATAVSLIGKSKTLHTNVQEKLCSSPIKTTKLIDAKPLPQIKLRNRNSLTPSTTVLQPIHVASGDHDYCIFNVSRPETCPQPNTETNAPAPSHCEEGSRWNVKHNQNITIKPIVPFNKRSQDKMVQKLPTSVESLNVANQSKFCGSLKSKPSCKNIQKDQLDHRTNENVGTVVEKDSGSVLMSPDSSPCRSEAGETRTGVGNENAPVPRRALRCYRKYKSSPSPQKSSWNDRKTSGSRSCSSESDNESTSSSSSSRSRSRSPPSKRRKCRSRSPRSRSSSMSSYGSNSRSRSSSYSSRSCSPSSSQSRSRSRSTSRRRYRSRSRRCESRESYNRQKLYHKERAIEERRVVYIGKISSQMTRSELKRRFSVFGDIEECTIHFREQGDNYGFVTYHNTREAFSAIENGHKLRLPDELPFDLCFGGRRQFCKSNYADLDSNRDDFDPTPVRNKFESLDFDTLLKQAQKSHRR